MKSSSHIKYISYQARIFVRFYIKQNKANDSAHFSYAKLSLGSNIAFYETVLPLSAIIGFVQTLIILY